MIFTMKDYFKTTPCYLHYYERYNATYSNYLGVIVREISIHIQHAAHLCLNSRATKDLKQNE